MYNITPVIMAGGSGTRLWPLSRALFPKQFLHLGADSHTLLQSTLLRLQALNHNKPIIICNQEHRFLVAEQIRAIGVDATIILEPTSKNTAPAISLAAAYLNQHNPNTTMLVLPADHSINKPSLFIEKIIQANDLANDEYMVTFGIKPTHAETGYGYIQKGEPISHAYHIKKFVEKPEAKIAQHYLEAGDFLWNGGIFMFGVKKFLSELKQHAPDILQHCTQAIQNMCNDLDFVRVGELDFEQCRSESIDYAVMEKTTSAVVIPLDIGWSDVGSWSALWDIEQKDDDGNIIKGDVISYQSHNNYCHSESRLLTLLGVDNLIVVETKDAVLVANKNSAQDVKKIIERLKQDNRYEYREHREIYRPWGKYDCIDKATRYQVKRITVNPGQKLSMQMHHHRSEHWIVVSGTAKVHKGGDTLLLTENQSVYIPLGEIHSLENPGKLPLDLIEVQSGAYLGEDDIVRFDDIYGRT